MRLLNAQVLNFGSYKTLTLNFANQGLALIYGATGSGKSTIQDIPMWILFGTTAKNGSVDEIRSWSAQDEATLGVLSIQLNDSTITITRIRGSTSENDLYWQEEGSDDFYRGKDITDTQRLLNIRLNANEYIYTVGAYYNEFSPTGVFFTSKSSDRRQLFENMANLEFPTQLLEKLTLDLKTVKKDIIENTKKYNLLQGTLQQLQKMYSSTLIKIDEWEQEKVNKINILKQKIESFEQDKNNKINDLLQKQREYEIEKELKRETLQQKIKLYKIAQAENKSKCNECGEPNKAWQQSNNELGKLSIQKDNLESTVNPHTSYLDRAQKEENKYEDQLKDWKIASNPFQSQKDSAICDLEDTNGAIKSQLFQLTTLQTKESALEQLRKITENLKKELCKNTIKQVNTETNRLLETYFDSELKVIFELESSDRLSTDIWKSGYLCSYKQLSKGQRSLLKLCFSISCMKAVANKSGINFKTLMMDEALDGLDSVLKLKAFNLFAELAMSHETVFIIDHNEGLQNLFDKQYCVTIDSDISAIKEV